ncbi:serine hydrolase [Ureibacillus sp. NPDC094379]
MKKIIHQMIQDVPYNVHLVVKDAKENQFLIGEQLDEVFSSASLIKVPILLAVLDHLERTNQSLEYILEITPENLVEFSVLTEQKATSCTIYELLVWMIITSDNSATNVLIDYIGMEELNIYFSDVGLTQTKLQRKMMDFKRLEQGFDNVTTARDMAHAFTSLYRQTLLSQHYNAIAINILSRQRIFEGLKRYLVDDVKIAHKTGGLETVNHDVGIVFTDTVDYIIGVFVTEVSNNDEARQLIGRISKVVYNELIGKERNSR